MALPVSLAAFIVTPLGLTLPGFGWLDEILNFLAQIINDLIYTAFFSGSERNAFYDILSGYNAFFGGNFLNVQGAISTTFNTVAIAALSLGSVALMARFTKMVWARQGNAGTILFDILPRFLTLNLFLNPMVNKGTPIVYGFLMWFLNAFSGAQGAFVKMFLGTKTYPILQTQYQCSGTFELDAHTLCNHVGHMLSLLNSANQTLPELILIVLLVLFLFYFLVLILFRTVALFFAMVLAPLCFALGAFQWNNKFTQAWVEIFISCLIQPLLLGIGLGVSLALAQGIMDTGTKGALSGNPVFLIAGTGSLLLGLWFTGKLVRQFVSSHLGVHAFSQAAKLGMDAAGVVVGGAVGAKALAARGASGLGNMTGLHPHKGLKERLGNNVSSQVGNNALGRFATDMAGGSVLAGAALSAGLALKSRVAPAKSGQVSPDQRRLANQRLAADASMAGRLPNRFAQEWADARGLNTNQMTLQEISKAWVSAPENVPLITGFEEYAADHMTVDGGTPLMQWYADPARLGSLDSLHQSALMNARLEAAKMLGRPTPRTTPGPDSTRAPLNQPPTRRSPEDDWRIRQLGSGIEDDGRGAPKGD